MSGRLVGEVLKDRLEDVPEQRQRRGMREVLVVLAEAAGPDGVAWPSNATIAERAMLSTRQVVRHLHRLEQVGRIRAVEGRSGGRARTTRWLVLGAAAIAGKGDTTAPYEPPERVTRAPEKGDTQMSPEPYEPLSPPSPPPAAKRRRPPGASAPAAAPSLPGLGPGEEGLSALGRAAGKGPRSARRRARLEREAQARRMAEEASAARRAELEAYERRAMTPEALAARRAVREQVLGPRRAIGG